MIEHYGFYRDVYSCQLYNGPECVSLGSSRISRNVARMNAYRNYRRNRAPIKQIVTAWQGRKRVYNSEFSIGAKITELVQAWQNQGFRVVVRKLYV